MALRWPDSAEWAEEGVYSAAASVSTQTTKKRKLDKDLTHRDGDDDAEDVFDPGDDSDLDLGFGEEEGVESVGLDTATGFDDAGDDIELAHSADEDEDERWSVDSEEAGEASELADSDGELATGDEYGWIDDDESVSDDDESFDIGIGDDETASRDDGGAEGLEDDSDLDDLNLSQLPALDSDDSDDGAASSLESLDELSGLSLADEPSIEIVPGELWKALPARAVRLTRIALPSAARVRLATYQDTLFVCSDALYRLAADATELTRMPLPSTGGEPEALATAEFEGTLHLAAVVGGRVFVSKDSGRSFEPFPATGIAQVFYTRSVGGLRLWWRTQRGTLGGDWTSGPVLPNELDGEILALHTDRGRSVAALCRQRGRRVVLFSSDAGKRFTKHPVPALGSATLALEVCASAVLLASEADARCAWLPEGFVPVATSERAPAALSLEDDEPFVYACASRGAEWVLMRRAVRTTRSAPLMITSIPKESMPELDQLAVGYTDGGSVSVYLAGRGSLLRVDASLDSEELA